MSGQLFLPASAISRLSSTVSARWNFFYCVGKVELFLLSRPGGTCNIGASVENGVLCERFCKRDFCASAREMSGSGNSIPQPLNSKLKFTILYELADQKDIWCPFCKRLKNWSEKIQNSKRYFSTLNFVAAGAAVPNQACRIVGCRKT